MAIGLLASTVTMTSNAASARAASCGKYGRRVGCGRPPPRSILANAFSHKSRASIIAATSPAACRAPSSAMSASPPQYTAALPGAHATSAAAHPSMKSRVFATFSSSTASSASSPVSLSSSSRARFARNPSGRSHDRSCGTMSVATRPSPSALGRSNARRFVARSASMASSRAAPGTADRCECADTVRANASTSISRSASAPWCHVAISPTMLITGELARRALCRLAMALAKPGPR